MAGNRLMSISQDERERAVFRSRRMFQTDMQSDLATAEDRGERRGRAEGRAEGVLSAVQSLMDSMGLSVDQAMNVLKIAETDRPKYRSMLSGQ